MSEEKARLVIEEDGKLQIVGMAPKVLTLLTALTISILEDLDDEDRLYMLELIKENVVEHFEEGDGIQKQEGYW